MMCNPRTLTAGVGVDFSARLFCALPDAICSRRACLRPGELHALYPRIGSFISASAARPLGPYGFPNDSPIS